MNNFKSVFKKTLRFVLKPLSFIPALIMVYIILNFSAQTGEHSGSLSLEISERLVRVGDVILDKNLSDSRVVTLSNTIHPYIRKLAHVIEYCLLAITVAFPLYVYKLRGIFLVLFAGFICVSIACIDEYSQTFSPGRGPSIKDVCIDSVGIFIGIYFTRFMGYIGRKSFFDFLSSDKE